MIDSSRRTVLTTGAAAAAATTAPQAFGQTPQADVPPGLPADLKAGFYEKGNVRIGYAEIGSGFPLLATPGGGLNSRLGQGVPRAEKAVLRTSAAESTIFASVNILATLG